MTLKSAPSMTPPCWNLKDLYLAPDDRAIDADFETLLKRTGQFAENYRGRVSTATDAEVLAAAVAEFEEIQRLLARPAVYAHLVFEGDTSRPEHGALLQKVRLKTTEIQNHLIFFELELGVIPQEQWEVLARDERLAPWLHYLEQERIRARRHLSEPEERVIQELAVTGSAAFNRLFDEITARMRFSVQADGEIQDLGQSETLALLYHPEREVRRGAAAAVSATLRSNSHVLTYIFNTLLQHKATMDRLRGYASPEESRHENNEVPQAAVDAVVAAVTAGFPTVARYYRLKRGMLGLDRLTHYDRYAPLLQSKEEIPWDEAQTLVLDAFTDFSPRMREMAEMFFEREWIDAGVRPGKGTGAFCTGVTPDLHPYVFMNYTGRARDVMTLAHELGHGMHDVLASGNHYLHYHPSLPVAETASVFAEMLVFERLQQRTEDPRERLALLTSKIEDTLATAFRQICMFRFEREAHRKLREEGEQTVEAYNALWQQYMGEMFGDSLQLEEEHGWWWLYIPHIFGMPFYVYAYAFGELLVLSLYARYRQEGAAFLQGYLDLLSAGGSATPAELLSRLNIDIADPDFWAGGVKLIDEMVTRAEADARSAGF